MKKTTRSTTGNVANGRVWNVAVLYERWIWRAQSCLSPFVFAQGSTSSLNNLPFIFPIENSRKQKGWSQMMHFGTEIADAQRRIELFLPATGRKQNIGSLQLSSLSRSITWFSRVSPQSASQWQFPYPLPDKKKKQPQQPKVSHSALKRLFIKVSS